MGDDGNGQVARACRADLEGAANLTETPSGLGSSILDLG
jgi:hypothetical protein